MSGQNWSDSLLIQAAGVMNEIRENPHDASVLGWRGLLKPGLTVLETDQQTQRVHRCSKDVACTRHERPKSPTVTLLWHSESDGKQRIAVCKSDQSVIQVNTGHRNLSREESGM